MKVRDANLQVYKKNSFATSFMNFAIIYLECITIRCY